MVKYARKTNVREHNAMRDSAMSSMHSTHGADDAWEMSRRARKNGKTRKETSASTNWRGMLQYVCSVRQSAAHPNLSEIA